MRQTFSVSILAASLTTVTLFADNWPQWRGPELNGVSRERGLATTWTQTENVAWKLADAEPQRRHADRLERHDLPQRRAASRRRASSSCGASTAIPAP